MLGHYMSSYRNSPRVSHLGLAYNSAIEDV